MATIYRCYFESEAAKKMERDKCRFKYLGKTECLTKGMKQTFTFILQNTSTNTRKKSNQYLKKNASF